MKSLEPIENKEFVGRVLERERLREIDTYDGAAIIIIYGRRRVGKTELIEQSYRNRNILKFEGLEGKNEKVQREHVMTEIAKYTGEMHYAKVQTQNWIEILEILAKLTKKGRWTLYFEELQWLANYRSDLISELKYVWDNYFRHNHQLRIVLCGSSPSFMINKVVFSKALYNRSQYEINLKPLNIKESHQLLSNRSQREVMDAYLTLGGIPEYLKRLIKQPSVFLGICNHTFKENSYFSNEYQRIFISSLADSVHYIEIIEFLAQKRFSTRNEIAKHINIEPGGTFTRLLEDLELCGFIAQYTSFHLPHSKKLIRYSIADNYLMFYFKFIKPIAKQIAAGQFNAQPSAALNQEIYYKWLGFAFERFCRQHNYLIAKILGFSGIKYTSGAYFTKRLEADTPGFQIDIVFERADQVFTICEVKYLQTKVDVSIIEEFERKLQLFPNSKKWTIQKVLITSLGATENLIGRPYFDRIITLEELYSNT